MVLKRYRSAQATYPEAPREPRHASLFGLAPDGVYRAARRWPRTRWALTSPFHPYLTSDVIGGLLSVASDNAMGRTW